MAKVRTEKLSDIPATKFIIATGLFTKEEFDMKYSKDGCYAPLRNPANDVRVSMKQLMNVDPENAYPILMDYMRMTIGSLLVGQKPANVTDVYFNFERKLCPNAFTAFPKTVKIEIYDVAEVLDDLTLYSAQLGAEYLRLISILVNNIETALKEDDKSFEFKNKVRHNYCVLMDYARRLLLSRWYRVYLENNFPNPALVRIQENSFNYISSVIVDNLLKEYVDIKKCVNEHPEFFYDNGCL